MEKVLKNKRIILIGGLLLVLMGVSIFLLNGYYYKEVTSTEINKKLPESISLYVNDGSGYTKTSTIPTGLYQVDNDKSYCEGNGYFSDYDSAKGTIKYLVSGQDECVIYFKKKMTLSEKVLTINGGETPDDFVAYSSSQDSSAYRVVDQNGVRYEGLDPDNYLIFNDEYWRIIGTFDGGDMGLNPDEQYTKIIRNDSIGYYYWDSGGENDWVNSTLNTLLNGDYLENLGSANMIAKYNGNYSTWYLRGPSINAFEGEMWPADWYSSERLSNYGAAGYRNGVQYGADTETKAAIGLMYASDYGYAAYGTDCDNETSMPLRNYNDGCGAVDWLMLKDTWEWLMSPVTDNSYQVYYVYGNDGGRVDYYDVYNSAAYSEGAVRPTLYLKSDVYITDGDGSEANPYRIAWDEPPKLSDTILAKAGTTSAFEEYTSSQDGTGYRIVEQDGIRYEGLDPDNYVSFNGEEAGWRIVGFFDGATIGQESGKYYTKIVKNESVGSYAWDSSSGESWSSSSLYTYLNGTYYNSVSGKSMIVNANWGAALVSKSQYTTGYDFTSSQFYSYENNTKVSGYVGLVSVSDYGYAAFQEDVDSTLVSCQSSYGDSCNMCDNTTDPISTYVLDSSWGSYQPDYIKPCSKYTWLMNNAGWTLNTGATSYAATGGSDTFEGAMYINGSDGIATEATATTKAVYPSVYLSADVYFVSGSGSKSDPYIIN